MMLLTDYTIDLEEEDYLPAGPTEPLDNVHLFQNEEATKVPPTPPPPATAPPKRVSIKGSILKRVLDGASYYEKRGFFFNHWQFDKPLVNSNGGVIMDQQDMSYPIDSRMRHYPQEMVETKEQIFMLHVAPYNRGNPYTNPMGTPVYNLNTTFYSADPLIRIQQEFMTKNMGLFIDIDYNTRSISSKIIFSTSTGAIRSVSGIDETMFTLFNLGRGYQNGRVFGLDLNRRFENNVFTPWYERMEQVIRSNRFFTGDGTKLPFEQFDLRMEYPIMYKTSMNVQITELTFQTIEDYVNGNHLMMST